VTRTSLHSALTLSFVLMKPIVLILLSLFCASWAEFNPRIITLPYFVPSAAGTFQGKVQQFASVAAINGSANYAYDEKLGLICAVVRYDVKTEGLPVSDTFTILSLYTEQRTDLYSWTNGFNCEHIEDEENDVGCEDWVLLRGLPDGGAQWTFTCQVSNEIGPVAKWVAFANFDKKGILNNFFLNQTAANGNLLFQVNVLPQVDPTAKPPEDVCAVPDFCSKPKKLHVTSQQYTLGSGRPSKLMKKLLLKKII